MLIWQHAQSYLQMHSRLCSPSLFLLKKIKKQNLAILFCFACCNFLSPSFLPLIFPSLLGSAHFLPFRSFFSLFLASVAASLLRHMSGELSAAFKGLCVQPFFPLIWFPKTLSHSMAVSPCFLPATPLLPLPPCYSFNCPKFISKILSIKLCNVT